MFLKSHIFSLIHSNLTCGGVFWNYFLYDESIGMINLQIRPLVQKLFGFKTILYGKFWPSNGSVRFPRVMREMNFFPATSCLSICLYVWFSVCLSSLFYLIRLRRSSVVCQSVCLSVCVSLSVCLSVCLSVWLSVWLSVSLCLSAYFFCLFVFLKAYQYLLRLSYRQQSSAYLSV